MNDQRIFNADPTLLLSVEDVAVQQLANQMTREDTQKVTLKRRATAMPTEARAEQAARDF